MSKIIPIIKEQKKDVKMAFLSPLSSRLPTKLAITTFTPLPIPIKKPVNSVTKIAVEPTEPKAFSFIVEKLPTTAISEILNNTCKILEAIRGILNKNIPFHKLPSVKFFSFFILTFLCLIYSSTIA